MKTIPPIALLRKVAVLLAAAFLAVTPAWANGKYASIVIDLETHQVLHDRSADEARHPASLTKVMTLYLVFDALDSGKLKLTERLKVSKLASKQQPSKLGLKAGKGPFNIELFGGSPDDNNAFFFYDGAMSVLKPYIDSGKLVVRSKQMGMDKVGTLRWDGAVAQARMDNLLSAFYGKEKVHAVLSPYDGLSIGILSSLKGVGYCTKEQPCPVVSGQDAEVPSVKSMIKGEQYSTVFKDTRDLARVTANLVDAVLAGKQPEINDTKTYNNGVKVVPSYLLKPVAVDASNWKKVLIDSGYYKESQVK